MSVNKQLEELLREKRREQKLHDIYLENPQYKVWMRKSYTKEDYLAFFMSAFFMFIVSGLMVYFYKVGFFETSIIKSQHVDVVVLDNYMRGQKMLKVIYEPAVNKSAQDISKNIKKTLMGIRDPSDNTNPNAAPNMTVALSNNIMVHIDPLGKPFDIPLGWDCKKVLKKNGDTIKVTLNLYKRKFDRNNYYRFELNEKICA